MSSSSSQQGSFHAPGEGITGGYTGDSLTIKIFIAFLAGLAFYNAIGLTILIFVTFTHFRGVYFWSLLVASWGVIPYELGFLLKFFEITTSWDRWIAIFLLTIGWYAMITGQSVVLWSRLHLLVTGESGRKLLKWTKWMILIDAIILHIPTTVLTFGSNGDINVPQFVHGYNIYEKVQMVGFFLQELILSSIYITETVRLLRTSLQPNARKLMYQLFTINILIIFMDVALIGVEFANLYIIQTTVKGVVYSIKLKLEFAVLSKLVNFVTGSKSDGTQSDRTSRKQSKSLEGAGSEKNVVAMAGIGSGGGRGRGEGLSDFVDLAKSPSDVTHAAAESTTTSRRKLSRAYNPNDSDLDLTMFEHVESAATRSRSADTAADLEIQRYAYGD